MYGSPFNPWDEVTRMSHGLLSTYMYTVIGNNLGGIELCVKIC